MALYVMVQERGRRRHRIERVIRDRTNPLDFMDEDELVSRFRLNRQCILYLCENLRIDLERPTERSMALPVSLQILIALRFYAKGNFQSETGDTLNVGRMSVSRSTHDVTNSIIRRLSSRYIKFPRNPLAQNATKAAFHEIAAFPHILGVIDGSLIPIKPPSEAENTFVCRKGYHALNIQGIVDSSLKFINIVSKWPGNTHDAFVWNFSKVSTDFETGVLNRGWLLGDSAYPLKPWLLTPVLNPNTESEQNYNRAHKKTRAVVERAFGLWKSRFRCLHKSGGHLMYTPDKCSRIITATAVLHNICIARNVPYPEEELVVDYAGDDEQDANIDINAAGYQARLNLIENVFS